MADRNSDRHKVPRTVKSGAELRKRAKEQAESNLKLLSKTRRMTDFIQVNQVTDANASIPAVIDPEQPSTSTTTISNDDDCETSSSQLNLSDPRGPSTGPTVLASVDDETGPGHTESVPTVTNDTIDTSTDAAFTSQDSNHSNDIGMWPAVVGKEIAEYWIKKGTEKLQNCDETLFQVSSAKQLDTTDGKQWQRKCTLTMFERRNRNGEIVKRSWLCFSQAQGKLFCSACRLMSSSRNQLTHGGYCDWRHASVRLTEHETSKDHLEAVVGLARRAKELGIIECEIIKQVENVENYWKEVLKRVISVITFVCERGLALRGDNEIIGSSNNGNYLGILELLAEYDDFLKRHIQKHANRGSGHTNYLSSTICEEFVELMGKRVLFEITSRIKESRYYSISLDSTPDEGHIDQLTLVFRYMEKTNPVERFVKFIPNQGHKAQDMFDGLVEFLNENNIDISHCRGQSYDNAAAMSGRYNGLQAKVMEQNDLAAWIPCAGHSLNLVGQAAAECCPAAVEFFALLEEIYVFFTASTHRYEELTQLSVTVPKRINTTRWSCRADATKALSKGYLQFITALDKIADNSDELADVRCKARGLSERLCQLETGIYSVFWNEILERVNCTSKILQDTQLDLNSAVAAVKSLKSFVESKRDSFIEYEKEGIEKSGTTEYVQRRQRRRNVRLEPLDQPRHTSSPTIALTPSEQFRVENFLPVIDQFITALSYRLRAYELISSRFGFLRKLDTLTSQEIIVEASNLVEIYKNDLDMCLGNEIVQFADFVNTFKDEQEEGISREHFMYQLIHKKRVQESFPNVEIALRMYLVLMVSNCSAERSFSKMKLIKNRLRTTMTNDRLCHLALMSIESDILRQINFNDLICEFSTKKARKVSLL